MNRAGYLGHDRRQGQTRDLRVDRVLVAAVLMLGLAVVVSLWPGVSVSGAAATSLAVSAMLLALAGGAYWYAAGRALPLRVAAAGLALAFGAWAEAAAEAEATWLATRSMLMVVGAVWLVAGLTGPEVDARLRPAREIALLVAVAVVLLTYAATIGRGQLVETGDWLTAVSASLWFAAGVLALRRTVRREVLTRTSISCMAFALAASEVLRLAAAPGDAGSVLVAAELAAIGVTVGTVGMIVALGRMAAERRDVLLQHHIVRCREDADRSYVDQRRRHALSNVLMTIEGAVLTLGAHDGRLSEVQRREIERILFAGIAKLRGIAEDPDGRARTALSPAEGDANLGVLLPAASGVRHGPS